MLPTATAPAPSRATTSFTLAFGLVTIPVSAYTGTEETRVPRKEFLAIKVGKETQLVPVGRNVIRKDTGEVIEQAQVDRMAQASNGEWVILTDEEIADCTIARGQAEIVSFVPIKEVGSYLPENQMQLRPQVIKGRPNPATEKAYALLLAAMKRRKVVALVKVSMRGPARYALLDQTGTFTLVRTADGIREARPLSDTPVSKGELDMALQLIDAVGIDAPVLTDDTAPVVAAYVEAKATGKPRKVRSGLPESGGDIMAQLLASIDAAKGSEKAS